MKQTRSYSSVAAAAVVLATLGWGACNGTAPSSNTEEAAAVSEGPLISEETNYLDPVCQMDVEREAAFRTTHAGLTYGFCSAVCQEQFQQDPASYAVAGE